jgi:hypothetical protein
MTSADGARVRQRSAMSPEPVSQGRRLTGLQNGPTVSRRMTLIAAFAVVLGVPAALAVGLYAAPIRSLYKTALFVSVLGGLALLLYGPAYTLADIGAAELVVAVGITWVISFLLAPLPLGAWRVGKVALRAVQR